MLATLRTFGPDVVHLASPVVLGAQAAYAARRLGVPSVAVYQTDLAAYATRYRLGLAEFAVWRRLCKVHAVAARTLAPSRAAVRQLEAHGIHRVARWARGVDLQRFSPSRRDEQLRSRLAPDGQLLVGYVGRLAPEKELGLLAAVQNLPGVRLLVVGDGPQRRQLERELPKAHFAGLQTGNELAATFACLDVFVHTGSHETRLSREKRPDIAVATCRELLRRGINTRLVVTGDGPLRSRLTADAHGLPIDWLGFVADRAQLAARLAAADVALAPGPVETFGLAALEALACGTPVVANWRSALPGVLGPQAGRSAAGSGFTFADAVQDLLAVPERVRRCAARTRAEEFSWEATVRGFLAVHGAAQQATAA